MDELTVQIVKAKRSSCWYANLVGKTFKVYVDRKYYIIKEDYDLGNEFPWRHIDKEDAVVLEEKELTEAQKVIVQMIPLSAPGELPKSFLDLHERIWKAFDLGMSYSRLTAAEEAEAAAEHERR